MDRLSSREGGHGDMMPPPYVHFNQAMVDFFDSDDAPVSHKLQRQLMGGISSASPHQKHAAGPASEYGATPDSAYGTNSVRGKPSTGRRSLYNGSNASLMSTVARLDVGAIQLDTQSEASQPRSEYVMPVTGDAGKWIQSSVQDYGENMTPGDPWDSALTALDTADMFSTPDINNDGQSVNGGPDMIELHCFQNDMGYNCTLCPKERRKETKTRSEMLKHLRTHFKPFKCNMAGCKMAVTGFANEGDLKRHHTSCHKDIRTLSDYFMCHHGACKEKRKPWTRWDNMKKHISDVHGIKAESRENYRVKNNGPQESDLAGIGLPPETDRAKSPALDADAGAIDLLELDQLMAKPFPNVAWTSTSPSGSLLRKRTSAPTRIMPSNIRSIHSNTPSEIFEPQAAPPLSPPSSTNTLQQISSSAPLPPGQHRRSGFLSSSHRPILAAHHLDQRRLQYRISPWVPAYQLPDGHDALLGQQGLSKLQRPRAPAESTSPKRDLHRLYADSSGFEAIQQMQTSFDQSALLQYRQDPWTPESYLALHHSRSASKGTYASIDNDDTEDPDREIHLEDDLPDAPVDTGNHSDGDRNQDSVDSADIVVVQEDDDEQRPQHPKKPQKELQEPKKSQESQESRELQEPQGSKEPQQELQEAQEPEKDKRPHTENYIDLTEPDASKPSIATSSSTTAYADEATTSTYAVVLDDVAIDSLSDDRLQTVLKRLKRLDDAGGRLESLGYKLVELPVTPAKRSVRSEHTATKEAELYPCPQDGCSASFVAKSSLRKHEKRHERPFACTFGCVMKGDAKAFGSKNDWKRHEEGLHFQQPVAGEEWQCGEMKETVNEGVRIPCRDLFRSASKYQQHLISQHDHESDKKMLREKMVRYRAVPTDKCSYWCGFCKKRVRVTTRAPSTASIAPGVVNSDSNGDADDGIGNGNVKGPATKHKLNRDGYTLFSEFLSQRFNHIDNHFVGRGEQKMNIAQWVPDDTHRPKSNVVDEDMVLGLNRRGYHDNDMARRKRHRGEDRLSATKRSKSSGRKATAEFFAWACCRCKGVNTAVANVMCNDCQHAMCESCARE